jgi:hypothetical protein
MRDRPYTVKVVGKTALLQVQSYPLRYVLKLNNIK